MAPASSRYPFRRRPATPKTGGRFELGIGTGRPEAAADAVRLVGQPEMTVPQRLARVEQTIDALRELDGEQPTPVLMADELRRRDVLGISYFSVNGAFIEQFAPVAEALAGR